MLKGAIIFALGLGVGTVYGFVIGFDEADKQFKNITT